MRSTLIDHELIQIHRFNYQVTDKGQSKIVKNTRAGRVLAIIQTAPKLYFLSDRFESTITADHLLSRAA
jgi:hypothetical protein